MPLLSAGLILLAALQNPPGQPQPTAARISGRIFEEGTSRPVSSARVTLLPQGRTSTIGPPAQALSDRDGRYVFESVAPGRYWLDVQRGGYVSVSSEPSKRQTNEVVAGQDFVWPDIGLQKGGVIAGRVLDESGEPVADVRVTALKRVDLPPGIPPTARRRALTRIPVGPGSLTNDLGEFRVFGLPPDSYLVVADLAQRPAAGTGGTTITATYFPGTSDGSAAQPITVSAGQTVNGIEFRLAVAPAFKVSGMVVDETGAPVPRAMVMLTPDMRTLPMVGPPAQSSSDDQGRFVVAGVAAGSYTLRAVISVRLDAQGAGGGAFISGGTFFSSGGTQSPSSQNVVVGDADVTDIRLVVQRSR